MSGVARRTVLALAAATVVHATDLRAQGREVDVIERPLDDDSGAAGGTPPADAASALTPALAHRGFENMQAMLVVLRESFAAAAEMGFGEPEALLRTLDYRLGLIERYLRIHALFENQTSLAHPGPVDRIKGRLDPRRGDPALRPLDRGDLMAIAAEYMRLLQEKPPSSTGTFFTGVQWQDERGRLYFATAHEGERMRLAVSLGDIDDVREGIRRRRLDAVDLPLGATQLLPGGAIAQLAYIAGEGRTVHGGTVGLLDRALAIAGIALEMLPVVTPMVRAGLASRASRLPRGVQKELVDYLKDRSALSRRFAAGPADAKHAVYEQIQTDWFAHLDALHGRRSSPISISRAGITAEGAPTPARGIDLYAYDRGSRTAPGIVRELKVKRAFDGRWTRSATGLGRIESTSLQTQSIREAVAAAGARQVDQLSWTWTLDRAMTRHRVFVERARQAANPSARAAALEEAAAAEHLIRSFAAGRLQRQLCVMNGQGELHVRSSTLTGAKAGGLSSLIDDALPTPLLQQIARQYLAGE